MRRAKWVRGVVCVAALVWAAPAAGQLRWDVAPPDPAGATPPELCPRGDGVIGAPDALVTIRRSLNLITGFSCFGQAIPDTIVDVAPPASVDDGTQPPTVVAGGDGVIRANDALLILRSALALIRLVPGLPGVDLRLDGAPAITPSPVLASDADRPPQGNFPGPEDMDEGNGVLDLREATVLPRVQATESAPATALCVFDVDPASAPRAAALGCAEVPALAAGESRLTAVEIPAPAKLGALPLWVAVDADGEVAEEDEENNVVRLVANVVRAPEPLADLLFRSPDGLSLEPTVPREDEVAMLTLHLRNAGSADVVDLFEVDLWLDPAFSPDVGFCSATHDTVVGGLPAGSERDVVYRENDPAFDLLAGVPPGPHALYAVADTGDVCPPPPGAEIPELNEDNNATFSPLVFCLATAAADPPVPGPRIDLVADAIDIAFEGSGFRVSGRFANRGTRDVLPTDGETAIVELIVELPGSPQNAELVEERDCLVQGAAGATGFAAPFALPAAGAPVTVLLRLDSALQVPEGDEGNNERCVRVFSDRTVEACP